MESKSDAFEDKAGEEAVCEVPGIGKPPAPSIFVARILSKVTPAVEPVPCIPAVGFSPVGTELIDEAPNFD
jgi:hypothetical protein